MTTRWKTLLGATILVGTTTLITGQVISQYDDKGVPPEIAEMWQEWMKLAQPGPEHAQLARIAGTWDQANTHQMFPGAEPNRSNSVAKMQTILGGRYVLENVRGEHVFEGQVIPFEGLGIFGFDNLKQKHFFVWIDSMSTMMMYGEGTADETGTVITYFSELPDPITGGSKAYKSVSRIVSDDENTFEMYEQQPDGSWFRNMKIEGTRTH